ncbi:MAG: SMP-30/gluconolactonase/LRE family protein [Vicinamibacterales bacterium]
MAAPTPHAPSPGSPVPECRWNLRAQLAEGPLWIARDGALWFVDIKAHRLHRLDEAGGNTRTFAAPAQCSFIVPAADGTLIAGLQGGLSRFDPDTGTFERLVPVETELPGNRLNDAVVDPAGYLWFGSMDDDEREASGTFYRLDDDGQVRPRGFRCPITNGPAFSPDGRTGYFVDTLAKTVWAYDVDGDGRLSRQRVFVTLDDTPGSPDGPTVDADGFVWIGVYGGWCARRYDPSGTLVSVVELPVANVTKVALGSADGRTAYATTAAQRLDDAALASQPLAGGLFSWRTPVRGLPGVEVSHGI